MTFMIISFIKITENYLFYIPAKGKPHRNTIRSSERGIVLEVKSSPKDFCWVAPKTKPFLGL